MDVMMPEINGHQLAMDRGASAYGSQLKMPCVPIIGIRRRRAARGLLSSSIRKSA